MEKIYFASFDPCNALHLESSAPTREHVRNILHKESKAAWDTLTNHDNLHPDAVWVSPGHPDAFLDILRAVWSLETLENTPESHQRLQTLQRHHLAWMPKARIQLLASNTPPASWIFHTTLQLDAMPVLRRALSTLFDLLHTHNISPTHALNAESPEHLLQKHPTLHALYQSTFFGRAMPMLYCNPPDLKRYEALRANNLDPLTIIDTYLTPSLLHELLHFLPTRTPLFPHILDECMTGYLGALILPESIWPTPQTHHAALFAAPWFVQVGETLVRHFGLTNILRAHTGCISWTQALPKSLLRAMLTLGWELYTSTREPHFLSGNTNPHRWHTLFQLVASSTPLPTPCTLQALDSLDPSTLPLPPIHLCADHTILKHALQSMCIAPTSHEGTWTVQAQTPQSPIHIDARTLRVTLQTPDQHSVSYRLPAHIAAGLRTHGFTSLHATLRDTSAIDTLADTIQQCALHGTIPTSPQHLWTLQKVPHHTSL